MDYTSERVVGMIDDVERSFNLNSVGIQLMPGETAWDPTSTKRPITGPGRVVYTRYSDGGFDVEFNSSVGTPAE